MSSIQHMASVLARAVSVPTSRIDPRCDGPHIREHVKQGPKTTAEMCRLTGLTQQQVWGRLKGDIKRGLMKRENGCFVWCVPEEIAGAIEFLQGHGFSVYKPRDRKTQH